MAYRSDREALEERRADIERRLTEIAAAEREARRAAREKESLEEELSALRHRLRRARGLPVLEDVRIAAPCHASWDAMKGDDQVRFCGSCQKNVYDLSAMTRQEAERLVTEREGSMCVRFYQRADGTVLTSDCRVGVRRRRARRLVAAAAVGGGLVAAAFAGARSRAVTMGDMGPAPTPQDTAGYLMGGTGEPLAAPPPPKAEAPGPRSKAPLKTDIGL